MFKFKEPVKIEVMVTPRLGKDALITTSVFSGKNEGLNLEAIFFIFHSLYKSILHNTFMKSKDINLQQFCEKINEKIVTEEVNVETFKELKKLFTT